MGIIIGVLIPIFLTLTLIGLLADGQSAEEAELTPQAPLPTSSPLPPMPLPTAQATEAPTVAPSPPSPMPLPTAQATEAPAAASQEGWRRAQRLADCDTSTLSRQQRGEASEEKLSECEVELFLAQLESIGAMEEELSGEERAIMLEHLERLGAASASIDQVAADMVVDLGELSHVCTVLPQRRAHIQEARDFIDSLGRGDLVGIQLDVVHLERITEVTAAVCIEAGLLADGTDG